MVGGCAGEADECPEPMDSLRRWFASSQSLERTQSIKKLEPGAVPPMNIVSETETFNISNIISQTETFNISNIIQLDGCDSLSDVSIGSNNTDISIVTKDIQSTSLLQIIDKSNNISVENSSSPDLSSNSDYKKEIPVLIPNTK